jgi:SAM-dependent methyltransferase
VSKLKRIRREAIRFGDPEFDRDYVEWGFHDQDTQIGEAQAVLNILQLTRPVNILDLACGVGTHATHWARQGHRVTGVDISETFISEAQKAARRAGVSVNFRVADIKTLEYEERFDVVTWIEKPFFHDGMSMAIHRFLIPGGCFIGDVRNPEHPKVKRMAQNQRTWREENGIFYLERHERNEEEGTLEDVWIRIDPDNDVIEERFLINDIRSCVSRNLHTAMDELSRAGFRDTELRTMEGEVFHSGEEPYWLWIVARKS